MLLRVEVGAPAVFTATTFTLIGAVFMFRRSHRGIRGGRRVVHGLEGHLSEGGLWLEVSHSFSPTRPPSASSTFSPYLAGFFLRRFPVILETRTRGNIDG